MILHAVPTPPANYIKNVSIELLRVVAGSQLASTHIHAKTKKKKKLKIIIKKKTVFGFVGDTPQAALQLIKQGTLGVSSQSLASLSFVKWFTK